MQQQSYILRIKPQQSYLVPLSSNAHDSADLYNLYEYINQNNNLEITLKLQKLTPINITHFANQTINNITISAKIKSNTYYLESIGEGIYLLNISVDIFQINEMYSINFSTHFSDIEKTSIEINYQIIQRLNISIFIDEMSPTVSQMTPMSISGYVYIKNGSATIPFENALVEITVEFFGVLGHNETTYYVYTSGTGRFILLDIESPNADEYNSIVFRVKVSETRYTSLSVESTQVNVVKLSILQIIGIMIGIFVMTTILLSIFYFKIISPRSKNKIQREVEGDIFLLKSKETRRQELKSRLENYIRVPEIAENADVSATSMPKLAKGVNMIVLPEERKQKNSSKRIGHNQKDDIEFLNRDILLYKKEKFLSNALKCNQMGDLENAMDNFEKAALYAEKLQQQNESIIYLKKAEELDKRIKQNYKENKGDNAFILFIKRRFKQRDTKLVDDMKKQAKILDTKLYKDVSKKKHVALPFVKKQDHEDYLEYKKLMEEFD
jgi:hypothetical protein